MKTLASRSRGFTTVELIAVIVIAGTLAVTANATFTRSTYDNSASSNQLRALLDFAQKTAVASRRVVEVTIDPTTRTVSTRLCVNALRTVADCQPGDAADWVVLRVPGSGALSYSAPNGINLETSLGAGVQVFTFDALGRPSSSAAMPVPRTTAFTVSQTPANSSSSTSVTIAPETGYVRL